MATIETPVVCVMGNRNKPVVCRTPIVMSRMAAAARMSPNVLAETLDGDAVVVLIRRRSIARYPCASPDAFRRDAVITLMIEIPLMLQSPTRSLMIARLF
ncbi:hypothetical protein GCM10011487_08390 [Steroidobacter agaridevorans]|uniref:Uncharacterized protein n=1 Tax=Steroidobacter agaridevorans TaxID=2695856 RepID=A0A829Y6G0_9GAMM|nr:hypothetical protein GCM10011487_08390 [Steroidobacter agaridevorans]